MRIDLEQMREREQLHDRVELLGHIPHNEVRNVLVRGHIYLNCSLTEAFCIAILEAASCGLLVVSTQVGGVPEVLPSSMIKFAEPVAEDLVQAVAAAVETHFKDVVPAVFHERVRNMYSWEDVGRRTSKVYDRVLNMQPPCFYERLRKKTKCGPIAGPLFCLFIAIDRLLLLFLELLFPARKIELCPPMQM